MARLVQGLNVNRFVLSEPYRLLSLNYDYKMRSSHTNQAFQCLLF
jgi:hypothetical protein